MFCANCGSQMPDNSDFCANCGSPIKRNNVVNQPVDLDLPGVDDMPVATPVAPQINIPNAQPRNNSQASDAMNNMVNNLKDSWNDPDKKKKLIGIAAVAGGSLLALIILIVVIASIVANSGYKGAVKKYYHALNAKSAKEMFELTPPYLLDRVYERGYIADKKEYMDELKEDMVEFAEEMEDEFGKNAKITYEIKKADDFSTRELREYNERYEDYLKKKVTAGYEVTVRIVAKGRDDSQRTTDSITVVKYNGKWYVEDALR